MTKIKCEICGEEFGSITNSHLKLHNITIKEYHITFPDVPLSSDERGRKISEKLKGRTKENNEGVRRGAEKMTGKIPTPAMIEGHKRGGEKMKGHKGWNTNLTKENNKSVKRQSEKMLGRTKENDEPTRIRAEKMKGRNKENNESVRRMAEKKTGRTKETHEGHRKQSEKMIGRTKENDEGVRKMSKTLSGRTKENYDYLKRQSERMSSKTREKASNWQGGISFEPYCEKFDENFKERVRIFFDRKCYVCGKSEQEQIDEMIKRGKRPIRKLDVHHINYNKDTCCDDVKPLFVPLCRKCHMKTNQDKKYWEEFFTVSLEYLTDGKCFYTKKGGEK